VLRTHYLTGAQQKCRSVRQQEMSGLKQSAVMCGSWALVALVSGCAEQDASEVSSALSISEVPVWNAEADLRIGSLDDPDQALTALRPNLVSLREDGTLIVGQPQDGNVRVFRADGTLAATIGSFGQGPGEFGNMMISVGLLGDTIYASDFSQGDVEFFSVDGRAIRTQTYREPLPGERMPSPPFELLPGGDGITVPGRDLSRDGEFVHLLVDSAGAVLDTLFAYPTGRVGIGLEPGRSSAQMLLPFRSPPPFVVVPGERVAWVVENSASDRYRLIKRTFDGDTLVVRTFGVEAVPIPEVRRDSALAAAYSEAGRALRDPSRGESVVDELVRVPTHYRAVEAAIGDGAGGLVVNLPPDHERGSQRWVFHDDAGEPIGEVSIPLGLTVAAAGQGEMWAIEVDEFDVPYLVRFSISPPQ